LSDKGAAETQGRSFGMRTHQILGTKVFNYDSEFLSSHLADILAWWRGERKPKGVPVELARRCE
jgi:exonuclease V